MLPEGRTGRVRLPGRRRPALRIVQTARGPRWAHHEVCESWSLLNPGSKSMTSRSASEGRIAPGRLSVPPWSAAGWRRGVPDLSVLSVFYGVVIRTNGLVFYTCLGPQARWG